MTQFDHLITPYQAWARALWLGSNGQTCEKLEQVDIARMGLGLAGEAAEFFDALEELPPSGALPDHEVTLELGDVAYGALLLAGTFGLTVTLRISPTCRRSLRADERVRRAQLLVYRCAKAAEQVKKSLRSGKNPEGLAAAGLQPALQAVLDTWTSLCFAIGQNPQAVLQMNQEKLNQRWALAAPL